MDGNGALFGTLQGNTREILHKFTVDLPKKHGRGGQSALRFARLRLEKRHNYVRKVAETAVTMFIANDKVNVAGLVLAGSADFKNELSRSDMFDPVRFCVFERVFIRTRLITAFASESHQNCRRVVRWGEWIQSGNRVGC